MFTFQRQHNESLIEMTPNGFIDLQVNGYGGMSFSSPKLNVDNVITITDELKSRGTAAFCPTVTTSSLLTYKKALPVLAEAISSADSEGRLLGIHLEGPFISPVEGAVGVHPVEHVTAPDTDLFKKLWDLSGGNISILTIAPEMPGAIELIECARKYGVTVSIGHTLCNEHDIKAAIAAGATLSTHLGNGCPNMMHRHHNPVWAQLDAPISTMLISDGHHLPPEILRSFIQIKGQNNIIITSDMSPLAGLEPGNYREFGHEVRVLKSGRIENAEAPTLAGSGSTLLDCMNHLASIGYADETFLWNAGYYNPLHAIAKKAKDITPLDKGCIVWNGNKFTKQVP